MIACLLPARNAAAELDDWFESASGFADVVVALDDGSADDTRARLEASPLVQRALTNPARDGYEGWNDAENRQRLVNAAAELGADWVVFLDADERIDADDATALRGFLESDAIAGCAYGFRLYRDWGHDGVDPRATIVYRCFACRPGLTMPTERLHPIPVPSQIPSAAWLNTTIRMRHLHSGERSRARVERYREADPDGEWERGQADPDLDGIERVAWAPRPPHLPVLAPPGIQAAALFDRGDARRPKLACLLPVRNGERDLPGYLAEAAEFADGVIALDDGSTDDTHAILDDSPLVKAVLSNPARETYEGWDDRDNRQRLLDEARRHDFDWLLYLDCDERVSPDDAGTLGELLESYADPQTAYGFRVFRMVGANEFDRAGLWVYRLFSSQAAGDLPDARLHFVPVPASLGPEKRRRTTIRIRHLASLDLERRQSRVAKYAEADPELEYQASYDNLLSDPTDPRPWRTRPEGFPVLTDGSGPNPLDLTSLDRDAVALSAIVISRNDVETIERTVRSVFEQKCSEPFEVIVAASGTDGTAALVRKRFPQATVVDVPEPGLPGMARNAGLAVARGRYVSFPGSHVELPPGSLEARIAAHELGWAMVTGVVENGNPTRAGWASYFLDVSTGLPGGGSGPLEGPPVRCSYARQALVAIGGFPENARAGEDTVVNQALWDLGSRAYRSAAISLTHRSPCTTTRQLLKHHFARGRAYGRILRGDSGPSIAKARFVLSVPGRRLAVVDRRVSEFATYLEPTLRRTRRLMLAGAWASAAGAGLEVLRPTS